jgi:hypothetical protein
MTEKSILEQALLQINTLEEAVKQNAKGILGSVMKQELNDLLKESMEEEDEVPVDGTEPEEKEEDMPNPDEQTEQPEDEVGDETDDEDSEDVSDEDSEEGNEEGDDLPSLEDEPTKGIDSEDSAEDDLSSFGDAGMDDMGGEDEDVLDMTGAPHDEVVKVFKAMKDEDGIIVKKDGENVEFKDGDEEYIIKLNEEEEFTPDSEEESDEFSQEEMSEDWNEEEENVYEIELGQDDEDEPVKKVEATEAKRTKSNPHGNKNGMNRSGLPSKKTYKAGSGINEEVQTLKKQNAEYKKALVMFKDKLNEVAVFNANLAYATRLFTEHSTTKTEKMEILKRFDTISSITESKNLYTAIKTELGSKKTVTESVAEKITSSPSTSSSEVLAESKVYEAPQFARMKDLMRKIK